MIQEGREEDITKSTLKIFDNFYYVFQSKKELEEGIKKDIRYKYLY
jgi:hypothetical protein